MTQSKTILISTLATSLLVLAGCTTQTTTNTNAVSNANATVDTNTTNDNANVVVANSNGNTNADQVSEVDTSDWLTYENEEYGFTVQYPSDWFYFNKIDGDEAVYDVTLDKSHIRFTSNKNKISANEFVDITITVSESVDDIYNLQYVKHNNKYYIFDAGTWATDESLDILNKMLESIQFDS
jgi:uncharacterized lipoprotein YajG